MSGNFKIEKKQILKKCLIFWRDFQENLIQKRIVRCLKGEAHALLTSYQIKMPPDAGSLFSALF